MKITNFLFALSLTVVSTEGQIFRPIKSIEGTDGRTSLPFQDLVRDVTGTFFLPNAAADLISKPVIFAAATAANVLKSAGCIIGFCGLRSGSKKETKTDDSKSNQNNGRGQSGGQGQQGNGQQGGGQWQQGGGGQWQQGGGQWQQGGGQWQQGGGQWQQGGQGGNLPGGGDEQWQYAEEGSQLPPGASEVQYSG